MLWHRIVIAAVVFGLTAVAAKLVDRALARRELAPGTATRYRVLRRGIIVTILVVGGFSAALTIPQIRAVAGGVLASGAVIAIVVGFASQRTLGNFVAGLLIAISQPLRLGDKVKVEDTWGIVEEIGLTYTFIRADDGSMTVIPNEKLASDTIVNATLRNREHVAEVTVQVPLSQDLRAAVDLLRQAVPDADVFASDLGATATVTVRAHGPDQSSARRLERELRLRVAEALRQGGVLA